MNNSELLESIYNLIENKIPCKLYINNKCNSLLNITHIKLKLIDSNSNLYVLQLCSNLKENNNKNIFTKTVDLNTNVFSKLPKQESNWKSLINDILE